MVRTTQYKNIWITFFPNLELFRENEHKTRDMKILYYKKNA